MANTKKVTPQCIQCRKRLNPVFEEDRVDVPISSKHPSGAIYKKVGVKGYGLDADNKFCSLNCAAAFAAAVIERSINIENGRKSYYFNLLEARDGAQQRGFNNDRFRKAAVKYQKNHLLELMS